MELEILPFSLSEIPAEKTFILDNTPVSMRIDYNARFDFFTLSLSDGDGVLRYTTKLVYMQDALATCTGFLDGHVIIPLCPADLSGDVPAVDRLGKDTFDQMRLYFQ